jgi:hypothetical protein
LNLFSNKYLRWQNTTVVLSRKSNIGSMLLWKVCLSIGIETKEASRIRYVVNLYDVISCNVRDHVLVKTTLESSRLPKLLKGVHYVCYLSCVTYTGVQHDLTLSEFLFCYLHVCTDAVLFHFRFRIRAFSVV